MPQHDITCPSNGQPIDRLALAVSAPRGATPSIPGSGCYGCFAEEATPSTAPPVGFCLPCMCSADEA